MAITNLSTIWAVMTSRLPRNQWQHLHDIYALVEKTVELKPGDFEPEAPGASNPKWQRNVRNVLQHRKATGEIFWDRSANYLLPTSGLAILELEPRSRPPRLTPRQLEQILRSAMNVGARGERFVVRYEKTRLSSIGRSDLAEQVKRVSETNVAAGFDVLSFNHDDSPRFIEVKATIGDGLRFHLTANELDLAKSAGDVYWVYFVRNLGSTPALLRIQDPAARLKDAIELSPSEYVATITPRLWEAGSA